MKKRLLPTALVSVCVVVVTCASVPAALACSKENAYHCYAITEYKMDQEEGESVYGAQADMELYYGKTPWYYAGDRQNDELWVDMNENHTTWIEGGAYVGYAYTAEGSSSESTPYYFLANSYGPGTYSEFDYPGAGPAYNTWYGLYLDEPHGVNGEWCATWIWDNTPDRCWVDYRYKATELQTGLEYATEPESGAEINGRSIGWDEWTNWTWHESWSGSYKRASSGYTGSPLCINVPAPGYTYGSVAFAAPGC
jgi:hypothetical protein